MFINIKQWSKLMKFANSFKQSFNKIKAKQRFLLKLRSTIHELHKENDFHKAVLRQMRYDNAVSKEDYILQKEKSLPIIKANQELINKYSLEVKYLKNEIKGFFRYADDKVKQYVSNLKKLEQQSKTKIAQKIEQLKAKGFVITVKVDTERKLQSKIDKNKRFLNSVEFFTLSKEKRKEWISHQTELKRVVRS